VRKTFSMVSCMCPRVHAIYSGSKVQRAGVNGARRRRKGKQWPMREGQGIPLFGTGRQIKKIGKARCASGLPISKTGYQKIVKGLRVGGGKIILEKPRKEGKGSLKAETDKRKRGY